MIWAKKDGYRIKPSPGAKASCPACGGDVIAKCGNILAWHWAHSSLDCDTWHEPESDWHIQCKQRFPSDWQEVVIGTHRADVKTPHGVVEFQASSISPDDIAARESFYGKMLWVIKADELVAKEQINFRKKDGYHTFRWKHPRKSWWQSGRPKYMDIGKGWIFRVGKIHDDTPCYGWGKMIPSGIFWERLQSAQYYEQLWTG